MNAKCSRIYKAIMLTSDLFCTSGTLSPNVQGSHCDGNLAQESMLIYDSKVSNSSEAKLERIAPPDLGSFRVLSLALAVGIPRSVFQARNQKPRSSRLGSHNRRPVAPPASHLDCNAVV